MTKPAIMSKTIVVIANPDAGLRAGSAGLASAMDADVSQLANLLDDVGATLRPLFGETESRLMARQAALGVGAPSPDEALERFYEAEVPEEEAEAVAARLASLSEVAGAYIQPDPVPATTIETMLDRPLAVDGERMGEVNTAMPSAEPAPPATPDFVPRQLYRAVAPAGIDVAYAWTKAGGRGAGIGVIDCEGAWRFTHEDLRQNQAGVIGPQTTDIGWRNHGTAVVSVIGGDDNGFGVLGIAPDAIVRGSSIFGSGGLAAALRAAADALRPGDIILIEVQYGHPTRGYTSVEWWPAEYAAIRYAVGRGVIVVEAAGNGANNLDDPIYDRPLTGFPPDWRNAFRRGARDSGAVLVGAGAPPPGTHGRNHGPDRSRLDFSNFGSAIDVQGWGREVTSCGYGDLQGGANEDLWYSDLFSGTSSASPIVVGTLACVQGALRAASRPLLTPATARNILRTTGSPQQDAPTRPATQRIGNRPNLRQILDRLLTTAVGTTQLYRYWNGPATDHFYTTNWAELGSGRYGWGYEGVQCFIFPSAVPGSVPLYRYWNPAIADHFYTTNWAELGTGRYGWGYEGIQGYVRPGPAPGALPLYRYWGNTDHFYTTNWAELGSGRYGYVYEGVQCYVYPTATVADAGAPMESEAEADTAPPTEGGIEAADFTQKAAGTGGPAEAEGRMIPFAEKAAGDTAGTAAGPTEGPAPTTDWPSGTEVAAGKGVTININLAGGRD